MRLVIIASGSGKNIAKLSPVTVKERMGHTHINTTLSIYAHVLKEMEEEAAKVADKLLSCETSWETTADTS